MTTVEFIIALFCQIDDRLREMPDTEKDPRANLHPSELVTLAVLFALKGRGQRTFYRWLERDLRPLFPKLPERSRLFRLFAGHRRLADRFLAAPTLRGICDSFGVELIHPRREGRSKKQIGRKGLSNGRWIVGVKWCPLLNSRGEILDWDVETANVYDGDFQPRMLCEHAAGEEGMGIYVDSGFHRAEERGGDLPNLKVCKRGECNLRMLIETLFSQVTGVLSLKKISERAWPYVEARLGFAAAAYNLLISWGGTLSTDEGGYVRLSIAQFSL